MRRIIAGFLSTALCISTQITANAQSLSPMKSDIVTFTDRGALRVQLRNPYAQAHRFSIDVFDLEGQPVTDTVVSNRLLTLAPGAGTSVFVVAPTGTAPERSFYLCATSMPFYGNGASLRGQVCGKYRVVRWSGPTPS